MATTYNSQLDAYSLYHKTQEEQTSKFGGPALPALGHALAGSSGTAISNLALYPLDLVITRLQVQRQLRKSSSTPSEDEYKGVLHAFNQIYTKEGGIPAFYTGILQDTGKSIADSFLFFLFYNYLRTNRLQKNGSKATTLPALDELLVGALAGACSKFFTTPISNIVTRKQTAAMVAARSGSKAAEPSVSEIATSIRNEKGIQGFWSGYSASLVLTLNPSFTFFLYEFFKRTMVPRSRRDDPGARVTFLMAAVSKAVASSITYPFSLAKTRAQTSSSAPVDPRSAEEVEKEIKNTWHTKETERTAAVTKNLKKRSTVFHTILQIYRTEGAAALYEGISGEILKGFFSHGITMLLKEAIHKLIIQAYYLILKALKKYPSPVEVASQASESIQDVGEKAGDLVKGSLENISGKVENVVESSKEVAGAASERLGVIGNNTSEVAKTSYKNVSGELSNAVQSGRESAGTAGERIGIVGTNAVEVAKIAGDYASKDAGHLLGNARDMLGDQLVEIGKGVKVKE